MEDQHNSAQAYLDKRLICAAVCDTEAGINLMRLLVRMCGWNKPTMNMEQAAHRDIWHTLRQYVPAEKLPQIEHIDLQHQQESEMAKLMASFESELPTL